MCKEIRLLYRRLFFFFWNEFGMFLKSDFKKIFLSMQTKHSWIATEWGHAHGKPLLAQVKQAEHSPWCCQRGI